MKKLVVVLVGLGLLYVLAITAWAAGWRALVPHAPRHFTDFTRERGVARSL